MWLLRQPRFGLINSELKRIFVGLSSRLLSVSVQTSLNTGMESEWLHIFVSADLHYMEIMTM